jgi:hypothetical protein
MSDFIVLIHSNGDGDPTKDGADGHWVVVTDDQNPVAVNQLNAGGKFPHADCGEASVKSILASRGKPESIVTIEHDADAPSWGTSAAALQKALSAFGVKSTVSKTYPAKNTEPFRVIMNPLGGRVERGQQSAYEAAFDGQTIELAAPPAPQPAQPKPDEKPVPEKPDTIHTVARFVVVPRHPNGLPIHTGPNSADRVKAIEPNGTDVHCDAWTYGNVQLDPVTKEDDARWYRIYNNGGWIASAFVNGDAPDSKPLYSASEAAIVLKPAAAKPAAAPAAKPAVVVTAKPAATPATASNATVAAKSAAPDPVLSEMVAASLDVPPEKLTEPDIPENA